MSLHVASAGRGRDIFFIHGWGMHSGVWQGVTESLAPRYRVHAVDLPGMGDSPARSSWTAENLIARLADVLPEQAVICGWSLGGQFAMRLALEFPERVERLVLVGTTPCFVNAADWKYGVEAEVFRDFAAQVMKDYAATMGRFLSLQAFGGESSRDLIRKLRERFLMKPEPDRQALQEALQVLLDTNLRKSVSLLRQPSLLLHGDKDTLAPVAAAHWLAGKIPQARLEVIKGASHAPFLSHPAVFMRQLEGFLE
jgi:pimeloyl-[acyl-carrier protein] methyl ester esterase